jgi:hypothetical protein
MKVLLPHGGDVHRGRKRLRPSARRHGFDDNRNPPEDLDEPRVSFGLPDPHQPQSRRDRRSESTVREGHAGVAHFYAD